MLSSSSALNRVFHCPEESNFYSHCLESLVLNDLEAPSTVVEFGAGDGSPVIKSLLKTNFEGMIHGFELNKLATKIAQAQIQELDLSDHYQIHSSCFFNSVRPAADCLVSNPPYLPASDRQIYQPLLHGGDDGAQIAKRLLSLGYEKVLLMVSSYSHPVGLIDFALDRGYKVANFLVSPLTFGYYSSELKVKRAIAALREQGRAFHSHNIYLLAGVLFKQQHHVVDLSQELIQVMTAL
ncbi:MAG: methyltransferase [Actinomycetota bacterium]